MKSFVIMVLLYIIIKHYVNTFENISFCFIENFINFIYENKNGFYRIRFSIVIYYDLTVSHLTKH